MAAFGCLARVEWLLFCVGLGGGLRSQAVGVVRRGREEGPAGPLVGRCWPWKTKRASWWFNRGVLFCCGGGDVEVGGLLPLKGVDQRIVGADVDLHLSGLCLFVGANVPGRLSAI